MVGGGSPLPSTGLAAGSFLMTGSRAGSSSVTPVWAVGGLVGRASLTQKTALALGSWAANTEMAASESTVSAASSGSAAAAAESTLAFLATLV